MLACDSARMVAVHWNVCTGNFLRRWVGGGFVSLASKLACLATCGGASFWGLLLEASCWVSALLHVNAARSQTRPTPGLPLSSSLSSSPPTLFPLAVHHTHHPQVCVRAAGPPRQAPRLSPAHGHAAGVGAVAWAVGRPVRHVCVHRARHPLLGRHPQVRADGERGGHREGWRRGQGRRGAHVRGKRRAEGDGAQYPLFCVIHKFKQAVGREGWRSLKLLAKVLSIAAAHVHFSPAVESHACFYPTAEPPLCRALPALPAVAARRSGPQRALVALQGPLDQLRVQLAGAGLPRE